MQMQVTEITHINFIIGLFFVVVICCCLFFNEKWEDLTQAKILFGSYFIPSCATLPFFLNLLQVCCTIHTATKYHRPKHFMNKNY